MVEITPRTVLYPELRQLSLTIHRVLQYADDRIDTPLASRDASKPFCPSEDMVLEATPEGIWSLNIHAKHWMWLPPARHGPSATPSSLRWQARMCTQHSTTWRDQMEAGLSQIPPVPQGVRLWHATEKVRRMLLHTKHDLHELFRGQSISPTLPQNTEGPTTTLLITPSKMLGFKDCLSILSDEMPYLAKTCREYAQMACWLYGLRMDDFADLTRMCISRHFGSTPVTLQRGGGGFYDSGPILTVGIGHAQILYDYSPSLMTSVRSTPPLTPVRLQVAEGVMTVLDGYARSSYSHGYSIIAPAQEGIGASPYYTIDYHMDCMQTTQLIGYVKETGGIITHTPVIDSHTVQKQRLSVRGVQMDGVCPMLDIIRKMRTRLQVRESSNLLSQIQNNQARAPSPR